MSEDDRTVWVGNLDPEKRITQDLLYELFLQAGPLHYVRIPKDRESGQLKNFGFVCYLHEDSVPYAIDLLNGVRLFDRDIRVQSRHHQEKVRNGLVQGPVGVHSLDPDSEFNREEGPEKHVQQSLMGVVPNLPGARGIMASNYMLPNVQQHQYQQNQQSLMGAVPSLLRGGTSGQISNEVIALAQQQIALLAAHQPVLLSTNPVLIAPNQPTPDRFGSVNYGRHGNDNYSQRGNDSYGRHGNNSYSRHGNDNYGRNRNDSHGHHGNDNYGRNRDNNYQDSRRRYESNRGGGGGPRSLDNASMQDFKARFDQHREDNSHRLAELQQSTGQFDYSRLGPLSRSNHDGSRDSDSRHNDRHSRYDSQSEHKHSRHDPYNRNNSRR